MWVNHAAPFRRGFPPPLTAFNDDADEEVKAGFCREFRAELRGMPNQLKQLRLLGRLALAGKFLKEADDEMRLQQELAGVAPW